MTNLLKRGFLDTLLRRRNDCRCQQYRRYHSVDVSASSIGANLRVRPYSPSRLGRTHSVGGTLAVAQNAVALFSAYGFRATARVGY
jgi:hypothetical protein